MRHAAVGIAQQRLHAEKVQCQVGEGLLNEGVQLVQVLVVGLSQADVKGMGRGTRHEGDGLLSHEEAQVAHVAEDADDGVRIVLVATRMEIVQLLAHRAVRPLHQAHDLFIDQHVAQFLQRVALDDFNAHRSCIMPIHDVEVKRGNALSVVAIKGLRPVLSQDAVGRLAYALHIGLAAEVVADTLCALHIHPALSLYQTLHTEAHIAVH